MVKIDNNSPKLWDAVWLANTNFEEEAIELVKTENGLMWKNIKKILLNKYGSLKGLKSIEIGAGKGTVSLLLAKEGVKVTILDYSKKAIQSSKSFFKRNGMEASFVLCDALKLDKKLLNSYDISLSFGTAEHFIGESRIKIMKSHFDVLNSNGVSFVSVPNKVNPFYRLHKFMSQKAGRWKFGEEYPFSIIELSKISRDLGMKESFIGSSLFQTPFLFRLRISKILGKVWTTKAKLNVNMEIETPFDPYISPAIALVAEK